MTIEERCDALALEATRLRVDAEFRAGFSMEGGEMRPVHLSLFRAQLAVARAKAAIDGICAIANANVKEPA